LSKATEGKYCKDKRQIKNFLETIKVHQNKKLWGNKNISGA
jgi:hypothetical protein